MDSVYWSKYEARNTKLETNTKFKYENFKTLSILRLQPKKMFKKFVFLTFGFVSDFDTRISGLIFYRLQAGAAFGSGMQRLEINLNHLCIFA